MRSWVPGEDSAAHTVTAVPCVNAPDGHDRWQSQWSLHQVEGADAGVVEVRQTPHDHKGLSSESKEAVFCLDTTALNMVMLRACDGRVEQRLRYQNGTAAGRSINGTLQAAQFPPRVANCVQSTASSGAAVRVAYPCDGTVAAQHFTVTTSGELRASDARCLSVNDSVPLVGSWSSPMPDFVMQLWAKPLPGGSIAVLVLNGGGTSFSSALSANVSFTEVGISASRVRVRDVWNHRDLGEVVGPVYATPAVGFHDTALLVLSPVR